MKERKMAEGAQLMAEGDKHASSGFFKKPQWELAAASYGKAGVAYKVAKEGALGCSAYEKAAHAHSETGAVFAAAKALETGASLVKGVRGMQLLEEAAVRYQSNGNHEKGGLCLTTAGQYAEEAHQLDEAVRLYQEAVGVLEEEDRVDSKLLGLLLAVVIKTSNYAKAIEVSNNNDNDNSIIK
jgi:hypothetical protein